MIDFVQLEKTCLALIEGERNLIANLANITAQIYQDLEETNWVGFYLYDQEANNLVLGPFQGKPACIRITLDKGVCGNAFSQDKVMNIPDVHSFPGHIACDAQTNSELVIPLRKKNKPVAVLDIDSKKLGRFSSEEEKGFTVFCASIQSKLFS